MSLHIGILYHWSPSKNRMSILSEGLRTKKPSPFGDFRPDYICLATTPSSGWGLLAEPELIDSWDLWQIAIDGKDQLEIRGDFSPYIREVRVLNNLHRRKLWHVATRRP